MPTNENNQGFSLLELIFVVGILSMSMVAIYSLFNLSLQMVWENKARFGAIQLANQKIETARNLSYDNIGTVGGIVPGPILQNEIVIRNGINYQVYTDVVYTDDAFDGTWESSPVDSLTSDYKRILVRVSWDSRFNNSPVNFYTDIAPQGIESTIGGGTLVITVFDASGLPIDNANINIYNDTLNPVVNTNTFTNAQGQLVLPGVKAAVDSYQITVTKANYSTDKTYNITISMPSPEKRHLSVFEGQATSDSFSIDVVANMNITVQDINSLLLGSIATNIRGAKIIGHNGDNEPIYKYDEIKYSDAGGNINLSNIEWDTYEITVDGNTGYNISETNPVQPLTLMPADNLAVVLTLEPSATHSLITVVKDIDDNPIADASVHVTNVLGYDVTATTTSAGQAYFTPLSKATTTITIDKAGFQQYYDEIWVSGYTTEPIILVVP